MSSDTKREIRSFSDTQVQALEATHLGQVTRKYGREGTIFECPPEISRAVWSIFRAGLIGNGPAIGKKCKMVLTATGAEVLRRMSPDTD